jgi:nucleoside-diphosphate-sugar epimerase
LPILYDTALGVFSVLSLATAKMAFFAASPAGSGRVLITGASGFVGRAVCARAERLGIPARGAWRGNGAPPAGELARVGDLAAQTDWREALRGVSAVIHLAARVHVMHEAADDPLAAFRAVNVAGSVRLARQAAECGVRRLVYVSTVKVHGESTPPGAKFTESDPPAPADAYGISKWEAERALREIDEESGLEIVAVRPPLVYGPGAKGNFAALLAALRRGWPLPLASVGNARSLVGVENLADALLRCAAHPAAAGRTYLVADGEDLSTPELARRLARAMGRPARLWPCPPGALRFLAALAGQAPKADRLLGSLCVDAGRIRRELGWSPPYSVDEGLKAAAG